MQAGRILLSRHIASMKPFRRIFYSSHRDNQHFIPHTVPLSISHNHFPFCCFINPQEHIKNLPWVPSQRRIPTHMGLQAPHWCSHMFPQIQKPRKKKKVGSFCWGSSAQLHLLQLELQIYFKSPYSGIQIRFLLAAELMGDFFFPSQSCRFLTLNSQQTWDRLPGKLFPHTFSSPSVSHSHRLQAPGEESSRILLADSFWCTLNLSKH